MLETLSILITITSGGMIIFLSHVEKLGAGHKRNMLLTGLVSYVTMVICLLIGGERPV